MLTIFHVGDWVTLFTGGSAWLVVAVEPPQVWAARPGGEERVFSETQLRRASKEEIPDDR